MSTLLPSKLSELITQCEEGSALLEMLDRHVVWLQSMPATMPLFPDFTDHGVGHLRTVLSLAEFLIADGSHHRPDSFEVFTPTDAVALVNAIVLHDVGMHLTEGTFLALVGEEGRHRRIADLDSESWAQIWATFIEEAMRWDDRTCQRIFGNAIGSGQLRRSQFADRRQQLKPGMSWTGEWRENSFGAIIRDSPTKSHYMAGPAKAVHVIWRRAKS